MIFLFSAAFLALTVFVTAAVSTVTLAPWALPALSTLSPGLWLTFIGLGVLVTAAAFLEFEAFNIGKLGIVEMLLCIEIPITVVLAIWLHGDKVGFLQVLIMLAMLVGLVLLTVHRMSIRSILEKGAILALLGASVMGVVNFLTADVAQRSTAVLAICLPGILLIIAAGAVIMRQGLPAVSAQATKHWRLLLAMGAVDTTAWLFYALATSQGETAITTAITQGYPALALGVRFNRERFAWHQWLGAALLLAALAS